MEQVQTANNGTVPVFNAGKSANKTRSRRNFPSLPSVPGASDMADVAYTCKVDASPTSWEALPLYSPFSLSADGSYPLIKVSRSKAADLRTGKSIHAGSGRCYRVIF
ncbi:hypothetical protein [Tolypothrix sp. VBCCA 56010]|uniref:hypothetical protein n=1 Tax=Tolypothrix sp. VBCCA 56010 TaxID=3137731 RepID=UPI003D7F081F